MKPLRSSLVLLILAAIGGVYLFRNERGAAVSPGAVVLLRAPKDGVRRVVLQPANVVIERKSAGDSFTVRDQKTGFSAQLDIEEERGLWAQIDLVQSTLPVENPEKPRQYGLENPLASIEVDGRKLEFGAIAPFNSNLIYARGSGQIGLVSAVLSSKTRKTFGGWRDRDVFGPRVKNTGSFSLRNADAQISFDKNWDDAWHLSAAKTGVANVRADAGAIESALRALANAKISRWLDERGQNPARYGLGKPTITFESGGLNLQIGAKTLGGYAARRDSTGAIFEIPASLFAVWNRPLRDWRDRKILIFDADSVARIEIARRGAAQTMVKDGENWRLDGGQSDLKIRGAALDVLDSLGALRAENFVDNVKNKAQFRWDQPILTLEIASKTGETRSNLRFARVGGKLYAQTLVSASNRAATGTVFVLKTEALAQIQIALDKIFPQISSSEASQ